MKKRSSIGLGTAAIGRPQYINIKQQKDADPFSLSKFRKKGTIVLEEAYQTGIRHFDTAPGYGIAEDILTAWVKEKNDPTIVISTKWGYTYIANFDPTAVQHEIKEHSLSKLKEQWEVSKKLLPNLHVYQIHSATLASGVLNNQEVLEHLHVLKKDFNITIGLTVTGHNQAQILQKALAIEIEQEQLFEAIQFTFNVLDQSLLSISQQLSEFSGTLLIKEALANGRLIPNHDYTHYQPLYTYMQELGKKYKVTADAIALRFCMDCFSGAIVLSGAANPTHLHSNGKAAAFSLSKEELSRLASFSIPTKRYWSERKQLAWN